LNHGIVQRTHYIVCHILQLGIIFMSLRKSVLTDVGFDEQAVWHWQ